MRTPVLLPLIAAGVLGGSAAAAGVRSPVVVELFTAQGCASCPQADKMLQEIATRRGVIALMLPVDYWDYLGWADTFAEPAYTERQRAYARRLKVREIYTPEIVVNGRKEAQGLDKDAVDALIHDAARDLDDGPRIQMLREGARVRVSGGAGRAEVWLVRYDPQEHSVRVKTGDNKGKLVLQRYVVRQLTRLGGYSVGVRTYAVPKALMEGLSTLVMVQGVRGGPIEAVTKG
ncbi:thioredoxin family protein [Caulobacter sp. S45]|uniref:DUF1223 domain-containing protein n=1 Tax=Caulobacter sp. S45 TaxID=1641861 RepID=UPI0015756348|nr:DUF1223 domain-containing protein [Caulobacter sp. S45]